MMREIASRQEAIERLRTLTGPAPSSCEIASDDGTFLKAFKEAADRGYGKAIQPIEHGGPDGGPIPIGDPGALREFIARQLDGIAARGRTPGRAAKSE